MDSLLTLRKENCLELRGFESLNGGLVFVCKSPQRIDLESTHMEYIKFNSSAFSITRYSGKTVKRDTASEILVLNHD